MGQRRREACKQNRRDPLNLGSCRSLHSQTVLFSNSFQFTIVQYTCFPKCTRYYIIIRVCKFSKFYTWFLYDMSQELQKKSHFTKQPKLTQKKRCFALLVPLSLSFFLLYMHVFFKFKSEFHSQTFLYTLYFK